MSFDTNLLKQIAQRAFPLLDLTSLNPDDTPEKIKKLCKQALQAPLPIAAICIYPEFLPIAKELMTDHIALATVVNFPAGNLAIDSISKEIDNALNAGANEIDLVFPYKAFLAGQIKETQQFMTVAKAACQHAKLKTILETSAYTNPQDLIAAAQLCIDYGTDFLKTSTGKTASGATLEAAAILLSVILQNRANIGLKISGGIRTISQVADYFQLTDQVMGSTWITPHTFRIGASSLFTELEQYLTRGGRHENV